MSESTVYILLPVHNRKLITLDFVHTLKNQSYTNYKLILIDDGSVDGTSDAVKVMIDDCIILRGDGTLWWAGSLHLGIHKISELRPNKNDIVLMINDDTLLPENFIEVGVGLVKNSKNEIFCAQAYSMLSNKILDQGVVINWFRYQFNPVKKNEQINCLSTRGLFVRYADLKSIGDFLPEILPHYFSDYEYTHRAYRLGFKLSSPNALQLKMNENTTGLQTPDGLTLRQYFKKTFQIRSAVNPWTSAKFIYLAAPIQYKIFAYFRLAIYFLKSLMKASLNGL
jgi:GT2 family glycosyltransferase